MLQAEMPTNAATRSKTALNNVAKTDKQADIVKRLEELNKWQEEQKKLLVARQTKQREILGMEQQNMYNMLGLQNVVGCESSEMDEDITPRNVEDNSNIEKDTEADEDEYEDVSTEDSITTSQLEIEDESEAVVRNGAEQTSFKNLTTSGYGTEECLDVGTKNKPKKPFLKRGEGLKQRFKIDPDELRINNLPRYKYANAHPRLRLKPSNKSMKMNSNDNKNAGFHRRTENPMPLDAQERRFQNLLISSRNLCSSTPDDKSSLSNKSAKLSNVSSSSKVHFPDSKTKITHANQQFPLIERCAAGAEKVIPPVAWSKILDPQKIEPVEVTRKCSQSFPETEESIFELMEQKACNGSFNMDSTCIKEFMQRRLTEKLNETDDKIPVQEHLKTKRLEPVIVSETHEDQPSCSSLEEETELEQSQLTEESFSTESEETSHKTVEDTEPSYEPQSTPKVRVRFSDSNETHEYEEEEPYTTLDESTRLTAGSAVQQEGQGDTTNNEFFEQFRQALFAALQLKADQHQTHECTSDVTLTPTPKESTALSNIENNTSIYSPADLQEKTELIKTRLAELEKEIKTFKENNVILLKAKQDHELEKSLNAQEHLEAMERINDEKIRMEIYLHDERVKLEDEKRQFEQQTKLKTQGQIAKERKECERLRDQVAKLETQLKTKDSNHTSAQARLRTQIRNLEREQSKLHEQIEQLTKENKRLENENLKISREQNNKILMEINRNIAKLAPKQIQNSTTTIPEEGPPTLGVAKTVSKCIVAAATANKNASKAHKGTNTNFTTGKPLSNTNKYCSSSSMDKPQQQPTQGINSPEIIIEEDEQQQEYHQQQQEYHQQQQEYHPQYVYDNDDEDILKELETSPPKRNHNLLSIPQPAESSKHNHNGKTTSMKLNSKRDPEIPAPPPSSPRLSSGCNTTMKREIVNEDGSKDIWYPNGNLKKISADGMIIRMLYYNKDIKETNINEGTVRYYYAETNTWHTSYLDGLEILEFPNGQVEHRHKNGIVEVHYPNNSIKIVDPKDEHKQEEWRFPDGTHLVQMRNGDKILSLPNGQKEIHNKLHKRREYPDGTVKLVYPDGSTETRYSNGRVRLKDKDGKLVMDTDMSK